MSSPSCTCVCKSGSAAGGETAIKAHRLKVRELSYNLRDWGLECGSEPLCWCSQDLCPACCDKSREACFCATYEKAWFGD